MKQLNIALLAGGNSEEREISLQSAAQCGAALANSIDYNVWLIDINGDSWSYTTPDGEVVQIDKGDFSLSHKGERITFDFAIIIIHGTPGEDGRLQGYLDIMGVPYSSSSQLSSAITFDKAITKCIVKERGIRTAKGLLLEPNAQFDTDNIISELGLPLFVKPNANGSSFGVSKVSSKEELPAAIKAASIGGELLIEEAIVGREMGCGIAIIGDEELILPITEIVSKRDFFDYDAKYTAGLADEITPAPISESLLSELNRLTRLAYRACRCEGIVRIDFIVGEDNIPCLIEVNSIPGMSSGSIVPQQLAAAGITIDELYDRIIKNRLQL